MEKSSSRQGLWLWLSAWLPVVVGISVIMLESTDMFGADHTSGPLRWLWEHLFGPVGSAHWERLHHLIRKCGHFFGYGFIGIVWLRAWWMTLTRSRFLDDAVLALLGTSLVASLDELHQTHLSNRTGSPWDVLLDCSGALVLQLAVYTYLRLTRPARLERAE